MTWYDVIIGQTMGHASDYSVRRSKTEGHVVVVDHRHKGMHQETLKAIGCHVTGDWNLSDGNFKALFDPCNVCFNILSIAIVNMFIIIIVIIIANEIMISCGCTKHSFSN